jgi:hypothetical protein
MLLMVQVAFRQKESPRQLILRGLQILRDFYYVLSFQALGVLYNLELHGFPFGKGFETFALDSREVDEDVRPVLRRTSGR